MELDPRKPAPGADVVRLRRGNQRLFLIVVGVISAGLAFSAVHTYLTLRELRIEYVDNRVQDLGGSVAREMRGPRRPGESFGPARLSEPDAWNEFLSDLVETDPESIILLALLGEGGGILAQAGAFPAGARTLEDLQQATGRKVSLFEADLSAGRRGPAWMRGARIQPTRLVVGLSSSSADFILRRAHVHLAASGIAILALWVLSYYLVRTADRLVALSLREASERHMASLGRMSAMLAHEIRNPLGAMKGLIQVIREELPGEHAAQPMIGTVVTEAERLETLVTDLLTFARPGQSPPQDFDLVRVVREVADLLARYADEYGVVVELAEPEAPVQVGSEEAGMRQVVINVLKNAIEATPRNGRVRVEVGLNKGNRLAFVSILDEGSGLGKTNAEAFFEPFRTSKLRGSGLGLFISRRILERLGGGIRLFDRTEGGAGCRIEVPVRGQE